MLRTLNRTYEVLKVTDLADVYAGQTALNRTYEVLKADVDVIGDPSLKALNRTYEVLKVDWTSESGAEAEL